MSNRPSSSSATHPHLITPTVPPPVHSLANPPPLLLDNTLPNYLLPQVLDLLRESTSHVIRKRRQEEDELREEGLLPELPNGKGKGRAEQGSEGEEGRLVEEELAKKVERIGLMVGGYIAEKLTLARAPLASHLDIIKFICKDLFLYVYSKQIDNLRTNHRGVFVLQSHAFPPLIPLSSHRGASADMEAAKAHLIFPQALIQGALVRLGMPAVVMLESSGLPQCTFQIRTGGKTGPGGIAGTPSATTPAMGSTPNAQQHSALPNIAGARPPTAASTGLGIATGNA